MVILAVDPGPEQSAWVLWDGERVLKHGKQDNAELKEDALIDALLFGHRIVIEQIASYGMPVGAEVFATCIWTGRFIERVGLADLVPRKDVKLHLCGQPRAKDSNIRQALIDRFGGKDKAIGKKKTPGPLHGISGDCWQALALAVTFYDQQHASGARLEAVLR